MKREPKPDTNFRVSKRDYEVLKLLHRYRYLRSSFIHAFVGGSEHTLKWRLRKMYDEGYIARPQQQMYTADFNYKPLIYELDRKGEAVLSENGDLSPFYRITTRPGREAPRHQYLHDLMICDIMASIELGIKKEKKLKLMTVHEILERASEAAKNSTKPLTIKTSLGTLTPDAVFGIIYPTGTIFYMLEADRNNEPIRRKRLGSSYQSKLNRYTEVIRGGLYKRHYNMKSGMVALHVTTNETHMENLIDASINAEFNLFKTMTSLGEFQKTPAPTPHMLTEPWRRKGHKDFAINKGQAIA